MCVHTNRKWHADSAAMLCPMLQLSSVQVQFPQGPLGNASSPCTPSRGCAATCDGSAPADLSSLAAGIRSTTAGRWPPETKGVCCHLRPLPNKGVGSGPVFRPSTRVPCPGASNDSGDLRCPGQLCLGPGPNGCKCGCVGPVTVLLAVGVLAGGLAAGPGHTRSQQMDSWYIASPLFTHVAPLCLWHGFAAPGHTCGQWVPAAPPTRSIGTHISLPHPPFALLHPTPATLSQSTTVNLGSRAGSVF